MPETQLEHPDGYIVYAPMKIAAQPSNLILQKKIDSGKYLASEKKDGAWMSLYRLENGEVHLYSRTISKKDNFYVDRIANVPHIEKWAKEFLPCGTTLIGEIYIPGGKSNNVTSIMGCLPQTAQKRQYETDEYGGPVRYYVHDIIKWNGKELLDKTLYERVTEYLYDYASECFKWYNGFIHDGGPVYDYIELAKYYQNNDSTDIDSLIEYKDFNEYINEVFAAGGEGVVFKDKDGLYQPGKRPQDNFKVKEHRDNIDLVIIKCLDPEMEYTGKELDTWPYWVERGEFERDGTYSWIKCGNNMYKDSQTNPHIFKPVTKHWYHNWKNAVVVGAYNENGELIEIGRVASGFTDNDRAMMGIDPDSFVGKVVECACMSVNPQELSLRHPVFIRWRDDKNAEECLLTEVFGE